MFLRFAFFLFFSGFAAIIPSEAQDLQRVPPDTRAAPLTPVARPQVFKQEDVSVDVPNKQIIRQTREFPFTAYHDRASAVATGCQVFKEKDQELWWANCGRPINDVAVVFNVSED
jgi:hypothetical protein